MATPHAAILAAGPGWCASEVICSAGPGDRPFDEQHEATCVAVVFSGTFQYRAREGAAVLAPGALLLGNRGSCFQCRHDHAPGDRCVSFKFSGEAVDGVVEARRGGPSAFAAAYLPPMTALVPLLCSIEAAVGSRDAAALEEAGLRLLAAALAGAEPARARVTFDRREERLISEVIRRIEREADADLRVTDLAASVGLSAYRLIRSFRAMLGITPHQYVLRTRLQRAAVRMIETRLPISRIAYEAGFNDLSTFNARFRRVMGSSPRAYRAQRGRTLIAGRG